MRLIIYIARELLLYVFLFKILNKFNIELAKILIKIYEGNTTCMIMRAGRIQVRKNIGQS